MHNVELQFRFQVASDIIRDGLGLELVDLAGMTVAEVFRSDALKTVCLSTFQNDIPLAVIEILVKKAWTELDPFEDGTPIR